MIPEELAMFRAMSFKLMLPTALAGLMLVTPGAGAAEEPIARPATPISTQLPSPPTPPPAEAAGDATTQPFKPAIRVPRVLPVNSPTAALNVLTNLVFDAEVKEAKFAQDQFEHDFTFAVTNISTGQIAIQSVRTSCGCTVAQLPNLPWTLEPGASGTFGIHMDLRGKRGSITKSVFIMTDQGNKTIYVRGILPDPPAMTDDQRARNMMIAKADRQAVFKGECASCHATPTFGKTGSQLFEAACGICHEGGHRNEMVPDLNIAKQVRDQEYWRNWIANGKEGTLMPGFSKQQGGPLTDAQILSLAHFLNRKFPNTENFPGNQPRLDVPATR